MKNRSLAALFLMFIVSGFACKRDQHRDENYFSGDKIYINPEGVRTRWVSFENPSGAKGEAGRTNKGAKGSAFISLKKGTSQVIFDAEGPGIIRRIWIANSSLAGWKGFDGELRHIMLRAIKIEMFWDGSDKPAVSVPLGDFFGMGLGKTVAFESELFSRPEGRSMNCYIPMPFRESAKIVVTNESEAATSFCYEIDYLEVPSLEKETNYFHAYWRREKPPVGTDFEIMLIFETAKYCVLSDG